MNPWDTKAGKDCEKALKRARSLGGLETASPLDAFRWGYYFGWEKVHDVSLDETIHTIREYAKKYGKA